MSTIGLLMRKEWLLLGLLVVSGCRQLPPSKPAAEWTPEEARGAADFTAHCAKCHNPTTTRPKHGPGLQALTKEKSMPSGAPPTEERILSTIHDGHGMMEPVAVPDDELKDLLAYLHTL